MLFISKATVFPLTGGSEANNASSTITQILGGESGKSFSEEASINIIELAQSRTTAEAVAAEVIDSLGKKNIATLLIEDRNNHKGLLEDKIQVPADYNDLIVLGGHLLQAGLVANVNKNNMLVINFKARSQGLVKIVTYSLISKVSQYYIDLKREKAKNDFNFATDKVDSLRRVMNAKDYQLIAIDRKTLFTNPGRMEYKMPSENLIADKMMIRNQYSQAVANQQNAAYKLQKSTPIIKILDKPEPPYDIEKKSLVVYGFIGVVLGCFLIAMFLMVPLLMDYAKFQTSRLISSTTTIASVTKTTEIIS